MAQPPDQEPGRVVLSFQTRLTLTLVAAAIIPLAIFGVLLIASGAVDPEIGERLLLFMFAIAVAMLALIALLATLQYRWLGEVSVAERDRLRASLAELRLA